MSTDGSGVDVKLEYVTDIKARLVSPHYLSNVALEQHGKLEKRFHECRYPRSDDVALIAAEVGLSEEETRVWFMHRLAIWRKTQGLPANSERFT